MQSRISDKDVLCVGADSVRRCEVKVGAERTVNPESCHSYDVIVVIE